MWTVYALSEKGAYLLELEFETIQEALNAVPILLDLRRHSKTFFYVQIHEKGAPAGLETKRTQI